MSEVMSILCEVHDPREQAKVVYPLPTLLFIAICAIFCGAESLDGMMDISETRKVWLSQYIYSLLQTFRQLFAVITPEVWDDLLYYVSCAKRVST